MPINEESYEQTGAMREALEIVVRLTANGHERRAEIAKIILRISESMTLDAVALANLTLSELAGKTRTIG